MNRFKQTTWIFLNSWHGQFTIELVEEEGLLLSFIRFYLLVSLPFEHDSCLERKKTIPSSQAGWSRSEYEPLDLPRGESVPPAKSLPSSEPLLPHL